MNEKHSSELRGRMYAELAQYVVPKRRAVEVSGTDGDAVTMSIAETLRAKREAYLAEQGLLPPGRTARARTVTLRGGGRTGKSDRKSNRARRPDMRSAVRNRN